MRGWCTHHHEDALPAVPRNLAAAFAALLCAWQLAYANANADPLPASSERTRHGAPTRQSGRTDALAVAATAARRQQLQLVTSWRYQLQKKSKHGRDRIRFWRDMKATSKIMDLVWRSARSKAACIMSYFFGENSEKVVAKRRIGDIERVLLSPLGS